MKSGFGRSYRRESCRLCQSKELDQYLDLGGQPPANRFIRPEDIPEEKRFPLEVLRCVRCGFSQLSYVVAAEELFSKYSYLSSTSAPLKEHYSRLARYLCRRFNVGPGDLVLDVGANDGVMLNAFSQSAARRIGIEPSDAGLIAMQSGFEIVRSFLDEGAVREVLRRGGPARIVTATNVFAHIDDLVQAVCCIRELLHGDGVLVIEAPYLYDMVTGLYFDTVYHEHLSYLSAAPIVPFLATNGLRMFDVERIDFGASGPALRLLICRNSATHSTTSRVRELLLFESQVGLQEPELYREFAARIDKWRSDMLAAIDIAKRSGALGAYTAPAKGNTLLNYLRLTPGDLVAVAENNERKIGMITPGTHIPIVSDEEFFALNIDHALLLSWNYAEYFLANSEFKRRGGKFIVPLPEIRIG
jgi:hypothetical protein